MKISFSRFGMVTFWKKIRCSLWTLFRFCGDRLLCSMSGGGGPLMELVFPLESPSVAFPFRNLHYQEILARGEEWLADWNWNFLPGPHPTICQLLQTGGSVLYHLSNLSLYLALPATILTLQSPYYTARLGVSSPPVWERGMVRASPLRTVVLSPRSLSPESLAQASATATTQSQSLSLPLALFFFCKT